MNLRFLAERLRHIAPIHGTDGGDIDGLMDIVGRAQEFASVITKMGNRRYMSPEELKPIHYFLVELAALDSAECVDNGTHGPNHSDDGLCPVCHCE